MVQCWVKQSNGTKTWLCSSMDKISSSLWRIPQDTYHLKINSYSRALNWQILMYLIDQIQSPTIIIMWKE